jgi:uracil-DNA glycosylase family 4
VSEIDDAEDLDAIRSEVRAHLEWEAAWSAFPLLDPDHVALAALPVAPVAAPTALPTVMPPVARALAPDIVVPADGDRATRLRVLAQEAAACTRCRLHEGRTKSVFARGSPDAQIVFIGEGPGFHEDEAGEPFVGAAGQLLDKMIGAMGIAREDVYVCNVVKCRPPENRTPLPDEAGACMPYLHAQLDIVTPRVIVALGRCAAENLGCAAPGRGWRGSWGAYRGVPVMPTYHPAYLLRSPEMKRPVWEDLQKVMQRLGLAAR